MVATRHLAVPWCDNGAFVHTAMLELCISRSHVLFGTRERIRHHRQCKMHLAFCAFFLERHQCGQVPWLLWALHLWVWVSWCHRCLQAGPHSSKSGANSKTNMKLWMRTSNCMYGDCFLEWRKTFLSFFVLFVGMELLISTRSTKASGFAWYQRQRQQCCHFVWADWVEQVCFSLQPIFALGGLGRSYEISSGLLRCCAAAVIEIIDYEEPVSPEDEIPDSDDQVPVIPC